MRRYVYGAVSLAVVAAFLVWLLNCGAGLPGEPVPVWLGVAGILVAVATMASISFAVIIFLATTGLRKEVSDVQDTLLRSERELVGRISEIQGTHYAVATATMKGLAQAFMNVKDVDTFRAGLGCLREAEIELHLAGGTRGSLKEAIQMAFKYSKRRFLEMEQEIWATTERLEVRDRKHVRENYLRLKDILLTSMRLS